MPDESSSAPTDGAFGSWCIVGIVWDREERWVLIQRDVGMHGLAWSGRDAHLNPAHVVEHVRLAAAADAS